MGLNLKLRTKIIVGLSVPAGILLALSVYAFAHAMTVQDAAYLTRDESAVFAKLAMRMKLDNVQVQQWLTDASATGADDGLAEAADYAKRFTEGLAEFRQMYSEENDTQGLRQLDELTQTFDAYYACGREMAHAYMTEGREAGNKIMATFDGHAEAITKKMNDLVDQQMAELDESMAAIVDATAALQTGLIVGAVSALLLCTLLGWATLRSIIGTVNPIVQRARRIASGDLTGQALVVRSKDDLGELTSSINEMCTALRTLVTEMNTTSNEVAGGATEIAASAEQMAQGMSQQTAQAQQVSSAVEELSSTVTEVARKSADAATNADDAGRQADEGGKVVERTVTGMKQIADAVGDSAATIDSLGKRGEQIGTIINVIKDIADQTNLLALNAAIEAARAGEHGRGFAVVADEVRKLAERTTTATGEVSESIQAIQQETHTAVEKMGNGTEAVSGGVALAEQAGESLRSIVDSSGKVAMLIQAIAAAAEQQSAASEQIARNVESISAVTQQSAEGASLAATAATQLSMKAEQLQELVRQFEL